MTHPILSHTPPQVLDATRIVSYASCPRRFFYEHCNHIRSTTSAMSLIFGGAFASGLEKYRTARHGGIPHAEALDLSHERILWKWGDFQLEADKPTDPRSLLRCHHALEAYLLEFPWETDRLRPHPSPTGGFEFSLSLPLDRSLGRDFPLHPSGDPYIYYGRIDALGLYDDVPVHCDEKSTIMLKSDWAQQWCFDASTELYTMYGWKPISQVTLDDEVLQATPDGTATFTKLLNLAQFPFNKDDFVSIEGRGLSQMVTPEHRVLLKKRRGGYKVVEAQALYTEDKRHSIPLTVNYCGKELPDLIQAYIVALQADGTLRKSAGIVNEGQGHRDHMPAPAAVFTFTKPRKIARLKAILQDLGAEFSEYPTKMGQTTIRVSGFTTLQIVAHNFLTEDKHFITGTEHLFGRAFLAELQHWNGHNNQYYTAIESNALFVQTVAHLNSTYAGIYTREDGLKVVMLSAETHRMLKSCEIKRVPQGRECGFVYCPTVPTGFVLTRRNGCISVSGNTYRRQFIGYNWALQKLGHGPHYTLVRGIVVHKDDFLFPEAGPIRVSAATLQAFEDDLLDTVWAIHQGYLSERWPRCWGNACQSFNRPCPFLDVCFTAPHIGGAFLATMPRNEWKPQEMER